MYGPNNVEFMGILVDRQYTAGQKYAQLVFETAEGIRLSLSRNINMVRALRLGLTYKVKGTEHTVGKKRYVREPTATLVPLHKSRLLARRYKILIPVAVSVVVILGGAGALAYAAHSSSANTLPAVHHEKSATKSVSTVTTSAPADSQPAAGTTPSSTSQQATKTSVTSTKKKASTASTAVATTPAATSNTVTTPATDDTPSVPALQDNTDTTPTDTTTPVDQTPVDTQTPVDQPVTDPVTP
jgi:cytoskeletal protein RodZ